MLPRGNRALVRRRLDYRPPAFLVDTIALAFDLASAHTEVTARYTFRRNPAAQGADRVAPLVLDGEQQTDVRVELDGGPVSAGRIVFDDKSLTIDAPPDAGEITIHSRNAPATNISLEGLYVSSGVFCSQ